MIYTKDEVVRVARIAFQLAEKRRKKLTSVDKANVLEVSQLWRATVNDVAHEFPRRDGGASVCRRHGNAHHEPPARLRWSVVLTENLFGDILSDEAGA